MLPWPGEIEEARSYRLYVTAPEPKVWEGSEIVALDRTVHAHYELSYVDAQQQTHTFDVDLDQNQASAYQIEGESWLHVLDFNLPAGVEHESIKLRITNSDVGSGVLVVDQVRLERLTDVVTYQYDYRNRLTKVEQRTAPTDEQPTGTFVHSVEYRYDVFDRRIETASKIGEALGNHEHYVYHGENRALVYHRQEGYDVGGLERRYYTDTDQLLAVKLGSRVLWALNNSQGSVMALYGRLPQSEEYGLYETRSYTTQGDYTVTQVEGRSYGLVLDVGFQGRETDPTTGLTDFRTRWYDPRLGTFISEDGIGIADDLNRYRFERNSSPNLTDPTGNFVVMTGLALLGAYLLKTAAVSAVETYAEGKFADWTGDKEFSFGTAFLKNFTMNGVLGVIPGAAETKAAGKTLNWGRKLLKYGRHYATEVATGTAADTLWDTGVNGKDFGTALTESFVGNSVGQLAGDGFSSVLRKGLSGIADNAPGWAKNLRLCFVAGTLVEMNEAQFGELTACLERVREAIEELGLGRRVLAQNPLAAALDQGDEPDASWSRVVLRPLDELDDAQVELLRSPEWLSANRAALGATIKLDIPELNLHGPARVVSISAGPAIMPGEGRVITGLFRHTAQELLEVHVEGLAEPIVGTPKHPYWSATRQTFVAAEELKIGEALQMSEGRTVRVTNLVFRSEPTTVYNIEVHGEHVYHVSPLGVLVHNASQRTRSIDAAAPYERRVRALYDDVEIGDRQFHVVSNGQLRTRTADSVATLGDRYAAIEAKFVKDWKRSISNPQATIGRREFAKAARRQIISQARDYSENFDAVIYHTNSQSFIDHYSKVFRRFGLRNIQFALTL